MIYRWCSARKVIVLQIAILLSKQSFLCTYSDPSWFRITQCFNSSKKTIKIQKSYWCNHYPNWFLAYCKSALWPLEKKICLTAQRAKHTFICSFDSGKLEEKMKKISQSWEQKKKRWSGPPTASQISGEFSDCCKVETNDQVGKAFWVSSLMLPKDPVSCEKHSCTVRFWVFKTLRRNLHG